MKRAREPSTALRPKPVTSVRPTAPSGPVVPPRAIPRKSNGSSSPSSTSPSSSSLSTTKTTAKRSREEVVQQQLRSRKVPKSITKKVAPLAPPPPIHPFSDDSNEDEDDDDIDRLGSASSSSSSASSFVARAVAGPEMKNVRMSPPRESSEEGWRQAANAILAGGPIAVGKGTSRRHFAVVCSSNVNRSIMAQKLLETNDMRAKSYGTGREVKLPGKDSRSPQSFPFGTPYVEIRDFLARQNEALFRRNSVLGLLERDAATKRAPERWQALESEEVASFDVVVCFESRVFDLVVEDLQQRDPDTFKPLHIVSMTIRDSAEDSAAAAGDVLELCKMLDECDDLDSDASKLLTGFRSRSKRTVLHQVCHI